MEIRIVLRQGAGTKSKTKMQDRSSASECRRSNNKKSVKTKKLCGMKKKEFAQCLSIVIRVRNAEKDLLRCLTALREQQLPSGYKLEIIVVDNESTDNSAEVARQFGAEVVFLATQEFSWGRSLNRGIDTVSGEIVLILSADAYPANDRWILEMITPFQEPKVVAVYGRQIPHPDAPVDEIARLSRAFPNKSLRYDSESDVFPQQGDCFVPCSNACAAIRRNKWEIAGFDESVDGAEESMWLRQIMQNGAMIVYNHMAIVFHSHKDTIIRNACRLLELWVSGWKRQGRKANIFLFIRGLLAYIKRRIINIIVVRNHFYNSVLALFQLPIELIFLIFVYIIIRSAKYEQFRSKYWS